MALFARGKHKPVDAAERLAFGAVCYFKQRYVAADHLDSEAFVENPKLAADLKS